MEGKQTTKRAELAAIAWICKEIPKGDMITIKGNKRRNTERNNRRNKRVGRQRLNSGKRRNPIQKDPI